MKKYLFNLLVGIPLAFGVMLTLAGVVQVIEHPSDPVGGIILGLMGVPLLYASVSRVVEP